MTLLRSVRRGIAAFGRPVLSCALLLLVGVGSIGFPVVPGLAPAGNERFPCAGHVCGCRTAEQCWRSCCCHSHLEKLAWAYRNRVTPPDYVLAGAKAELARGQGASCCSSGGGCCSAQRGAKAGKLAQVKRQHAPPGARDSSAGEAAPPRNGVRFIPLVQHQKCRGLAAVWWMLSQAVAPEFPTLAMAAPVAGERLTLVSEVLSSRGDAPEPPPPRAN